MAEKVLIIEDDKFLRELIARKISEEGYEVFESADGTDGLAKTREVKPDLILLDLILPVVDGFEVLARLKKEKDLSSIPVIILSNLGQKEDVEKGLKLGAAGYLIKAHFNPDEIIERVKDVLKRSS